MEQGIFHTVLAKDTNNEVAWAIKDLGKTKAMKRQDFRAASPAESTPRNLWPASTTRHEAILRSLKNLKRTDQNARPIVTIQTNVYKL